MEQFRARITNMKSKTGFNPALVFFLRKNKTIRCAIAFCRVTKIAILCLLSNGLYAKAISRTDLPSSERIGVNLTFRLRCNGTAYGYAFFAGIIRYISSKLSYIWKQLSMLTFFLFTPTVFYFVVLTNANF